MNRTRALRIFAANLLVLLLSISAARGEVKTVVEHIDNANAGSDFKFKALPAPSKDDAASEAKISIVDGERDPNSGGVDKLNDGQTPREADEPDENFFFNEGADGGRLLVDLGAAIDIKEVNTYSWHPNTRGPQVYKLYASDGAAEGFQSAPKNQIDPEKAGWKLIASIDTRPPKADDDAMGGQYGVSISDSMGTIGKFRYLLMVASRTEDHDDWGNTFFSEIDVIDNTAPATTKPAAVGPTRVEGKFVTIDVTAAPDLKQWAQNTLLPTCDQWYPNIVEMLPSEGFTAPTHVTIQFRGDLPKGIPAMTRGEDVSCNVAWFRRNLKGEATGAVVHEMVHVVQQYKRSNPGWLVEGIADYIRWFKYEPQTHGADIHNPANARYDGSYRVTANFLNWVTENYDKQIVAMLNAAMRKGQYSDEIWKQRTGESAAELAAEWKASLVK